MGSASSRPASRRRRRPSRPNKPKWTIASLLVCGGSPSTTTHNEMEDDSSNLLVDSPAAHESDLVSGIRAEPGSSIHGNLILNEDSSGFIHRSGELEESCSDEISMENQTIEVSTSYDHDHPFSFPTQEHIIVSDTEQEQDDEEDEEGDDEEEDEEEEQRGMVTILPRNSPENNYILTRENSRRIFWDAFSRRNSIRRYRGDSNLFDFDLSADSSDDDQANRIHGSNIRRMQSQSEFWERLYANHRRQSSNHRTRICPFGLHPDGTCSCDSTSGGEESDAQASASRVAMLAEALFEVLDEIHRQPVNISSSLDSAPAPSCVVDSFPIKTHAKLNTHNGEDIPQCYICLDEYQEGDEIRVLPCNHEYHMGCIDKWLKEINGVCPLCRGVVYEG